MRWSAVGVPNEVVVVVRAGGGRRTDRLRGPLPRPSPSSQHRLPSTPISPLASFLPALSRDGQVAHHLPRCVLALSSRRRADQRGLTRCCARPCGLQCSTRPSASPPPACRSSSSSSLATAPMSSSPRGASRPSKRSLPLQSAWLTSRVWALAPGSPQLDRLGRTSLVAASPGSHPPPGRHLQDDVRDRALLCGAGRQGVLPSRRGACRSCCTRSRETGDGLAAADALSLACPSALGRSSSTTRRRTSTTTSPSCSARTATRRTAAARRSHARTGGGRVVRGLRRGPGMDARYTAPTRSRRVSRRGSAGRAGRRRARGVSVVKVDGYRAGVVKGRVVWCCTRTAGLDRKRR